MITATVLHSVSYAGLWGQACLSVEQFIDKAADLGFEGVLLTAKRPHVSVLDFGSKELARLRSQIERRGLRKVAMAGYTNFTGDLEHGDIPHREIQVRHVVELAEIARDLGGDLVRVFTGYENSAASYSAQMKIVADALRECARRTADLGVTIGVQNHHDLACDCEAMHDLIEAVGEPNCKALFDAWAPALQGTDLAATGRKMGAMTVHTTIADYQLRPRYLYEPTLVNYRAGTPAVQAVRMGQGFIDYRGFLSALGAGGFKGSVAYEMCSPLREGGSIEVLDSYARTFLEYMAEFRASGAGA